LKVKAAKEDVTFSIVRIALQCALQLATRLIRFAGSQQFLRGDVNSKAHIGQDKD
jgi:hypothetical protein